MGASLLRLDLRLVVASAMALATSPIFLAMLAISASINERASLFDAPGSSRSNLIEIDSYAISV